MPTDEQYVTEFNAQNTASPIDAGTTETPSSPNPAPSPAVEMFSLQDRQFPITEEFSIAHGGQIQKVPYSKLINAYRQSSHLEDKYKKFNTDSEAFKSQQAEHEKYKQFHTKYGALQEWSESKPEEFKVIWDLYENRNKHLLQNQVAPLGQASEAPQNADAFKPFVEKISALESKLGELSSFKSEFDQQREKEKKQADIEVVREEMKTFQTRYPEINLQEKDPDGVSLWAKIIQNGVQHQIPTFKAAALDYLEDRIRETVSSRARNETVKGIKTAKASGEIARSSQPFQKGQSTPIDPKKVSWSQAGEMAKAQYAQLIAQGQ